MIRPEDLDRAVLSIAEGVARRTLSRSGVLGVVGRAAAAATAAAVATLRSHTASAYTCDCNCYETCYVVIDCSDCCGCTSPCYGRAYEVCDYYCCPPAPKSYCDSTAEFLGNPQCT